MCSELGLIDPDIESSILAKNKFSLRRVLNSNGFNTPKFNLIKTSEDLDLINSFPVVMKPVDSVASRGVKKISSKEKLTEYYEYSRSFSATDEVIVESYLEGKEFSVEALTQNGKTKIIAITEKTIAKSEVNSFVEGRHTLPANISEKEKLNIENTAINILEKLGFNNTATHTELKLNDDVLIFIIEIASRLGGDFICSDLIPLATGVNILENIRNIAIGKPINTDKTKDNIATIQYFTSINYSEMLALEKSLREQGNIVKSEKEDFKQVNLNKFV